MTSGSSNRATCWRDVAGNCFGDGVAEAGFTLIEIIIVLAIIVMIVLCVVPVSLSSDPGGLRSAEARTAVIINQARVLAASNAGAGNTGATLQFTYDATTGETVERVYLNRPIKFAVPLVRLTPVASIPEAVLRATVSMQAVAAAPPFAIFVGSAGHASAAVGDFTGATTSFNLTREPSNCAGAITSMSITFVVAGKTKTDAISCYAPVLVPGP